MRLLYRFMVAATAAGMAIGSITTAQAVPPIPRLETPPHAPVLASAATSLAHGVARPARTQAPVGARDYGVFRTVAFETNANPLSTQWQRVRRNTIATYLDKRCTGDRAVCDTPLAGRLRAVLEKARKASGLDVLSIINAGVNAALPYRSDFGNYGAADHWADFAEMARNNGGDCEDYAILKMMLLRELGFRTESLQIVVLSDRVDGGFHAVLAVHMNGRAYVLDNAARRVFVAGETRKYMPIFSFAGDQTWVHARQKETSTDLQVSMLEPQTTR